MGNSNKIFSNVTIINDIIPETDEQKELRYINMFYKYEATKYITVDEFKTILSKIKPEYYNVKGQNLFHLFLVDYRLKKFTYKCKEYDIDYLQILLDYGVDMHKKDNFGKTPIFYAESEYSVSFLIKNGAELNIRDKENHTPIYYYSRFCNNRQIEILKGLDPEYINFANIIDYNEYQLEEVLQRAILFQDKEKIHELLKNYPQLINEPKEKPYYLPLYLTIVNDFYDEFIILLDYNPNINIQCLIDCIALKANDTSIKMLNILIDHGLDVNKTIIESKILFQCYLGNSEKIIRIFLEKGADINKRTDYFGKIPLWRTETLFTNDADPLMYMTAFMPHNDVFKALFEYDADPNKKSLHGVTPFMGLFASIFIDKKFKLKSSEIDDYDAQEYFDLIQLFLDYNADINVLGPNGYTALDLLVHNHRIPDNIKIQVIKMLQEKTKFIILHPNTNSFIYNSLKIISTI